MELEGGARRIAIALGIGMAVWGIVVLDLMITGNWLGVGIAVVIAALVWYFLRPPS